jgi:uncharacterized protein DUF1989
MAAPGMVKIVADFIAFNADDLTESLSAIHTLVSLGRLFPTTGDRLRTNRRTPMAEIVRDDTGRHDMLIAACDPWCYEDDFNVKGHRPCSDNFLLEPGSDEFNAVVEGRDDVLVSDLAVTEIVSAAARRLRQGSLTREAARRLPPSGALPPEPAGASASRALHLALATSSRAGSLASFDERLAAAARAAGLAVHSR